MAEKGLPSNLDVERIVLGAILVDPKCFPSISAIMQRADLFLEANRRVFVAMTTLFDQSIPIDRITVANELLRVGELESIGGMSYIVGLDDQMPRLMNPESYARIIKDKSVARQVIFQAQHTQNELTVGETPTKEVIAKTIERLMVLLPDERNDGPQDADQIFKSFEGGINAFMQPHLRPKGLATGFTKFDEMTGGLYPGDMFILAARPSVGKTSLCLNIMSHIVLEEKKRCVLFSLETNKASLMERLICSHARVDSQRFRHGYTNAEERKRLIVSANAFIEAPIIIDDTSGTTAMDVISKTRSIQAKVGKVALVAVDYLQLLHPSGKHENRNQEVTAISRMLKLAAKDLDVHMIAISQLNRSPETRKGDGRPQLSDLRESGALEQDSDSVAFVFREEMLRPNREDLHGVAELILRKQRNGPVGTVHLVFLHHLTKFENRADDAPDEAAPPKQDWKDRAAGGDEPGEGDV